MLSLILHSEPVGHQNLKAAILCHLREMEPTAVSSGISGGVRNCIAVAPSANLMVPDSFLQPCKPVSVNMYLCKSPMIMFSRACKDHQCKDHIRGGHVNNGVDDDSDVE